VLLTPAADHLGHFLARSGKWADFHPGREYREWRFRRVQDQKGTRKDSGEKGQGIELFRQ